MLAATVRVTRDLDTAEEAVQDAYVRALETWGRDGVPARPGLHALLYAQDKIEMRTRMDALALPNPAWAHVETEDEVEAFLAVHGTQGAASASVRETVDLLTESVVRGLLRSRPGGGTFHIEDVQDQVELGLMRGGHHEVARAYVLYRERRAQERAARAAQEQAQPAQPVLHVVLSDRPDGVAASRQRRTSSVAARDGASGSSTSVTTRW